MSTTGPGLTQQATNLFQTASMQIKNILSSDGAMKKKTDQCLIYENPSTMDDTNDCVLSTHGKQLDPLFKQQPDLCEEDQFRACFLDCACQCSVCSGKNSWSSSLDMIFIPLGEKGHSRENRAHVWFRHLRKNVEEFQVQSVHYLLWLPLWRQSATFLLLQLLGWTTETNNLAYRRWYVHWRIRRAMCSINPAREIDTFTGTALERMMKVPFRILNRYWRSRVRIECSIDLKRRYFHNS